jgi:CheY-like chemotaxis protein
MRVTPKSFCRRVYKWTDAIDVLCYFRTQVVEGRGKAGACGSEIAGIARPEGVLPERWGGPCPVTPHDTAFTMSGHSILVVEDQVFIALDMEDMLLALGARECWMASNAADAIDLLRARRPDAAVLDFKLAVGTSEMVADRLIELRVPFVFFTGYGENLAVPDRFGEVPIVGKPVGKGALLAKLKLARERAPSGGRCRR